jgi:hypothetical protein
VDTINPVEKALSSRGIPYVNVSSSNLYLCPYAGNLAEVATMDYFLVSKLPMMGKVLEISSNKAFIEAKKAEDEFFKSKRPSYAQAKSLSSFYAYAYKIAVKEKQFGRRADLKYELLDRHLILERKLVTIDELINYSQIFVTDTIKIALGLDTKDTADLLEIMYSYKTFYGLYYLPFSKSYYRGSKDLVFAQKVRVKGVVGWDGIYLKYTEALQKYSKSEIDRWFILRNTIL